MLSKALSLDVKNTVPRFELATGSHRPIDVGAENPSPPVISGASAHPPQAPYDFDPSGCPPGRVFHFGCGRALDGGGHVKARRNAAFRIRMLSQAGQPKMFSTK